MTNKIQMIEQPVGAGKTYQLIGEILKKEGLVIYCTTTKKLARQVKTDISESASAVNKSLKIHIVDEENKGYCTTVAERLEELITCSDGDNSVVICTLAGLESISSERIGLLTRNKNTNVTLIIDELPNLFACFKQFIPSSILHQLDGVLRIEDGCPVVDDAKMYWDTLSSKTFNPEMTKLLELLPSGRVRLEEAANGDGWNFYGYNLKDNLESIIDRCSETYLLAATIRGTLDYDILTHVWDFTLVDCDELNDKINKSRDPRKWSNIRVYPLLDKRFSKSKATNGSYKDVNKETDCCLNEMLQRFLGFVGDEPSLVVTNKWSSSLALNFIRDKKNIELLQPNVKGINKYKDFHYCCVLYSAKPDIATNKALELLAEQYNLKGVKKSFELQTELDAIVQACGRTSVRDRNSSETCHFFVTDIVQAKHLLDTYVPDKSIHESLLDKSLMVEWRSYSTKQAGRPKSVDRLEKGKQMLAMIKEARLKGETLLQKQLAEIFDVHESVVSKMIRDAKTFQYS